MVVDHGGGLLQRQNVRRGYLLQGHRGLHSTTYCNGGGEGEVAFSKDLQRIILISNSAFERRAENCQEIKGGGTHTGINDSSTFRSGPPPSVSLWTP